MHVAAGGKGVAAEIEDGISGQLAWAVESGLPAAQGFMEIGLAVGCWGCEMRELLWGDGAYFAPAAGVDGVELSGDDCWGWRWGCGIGFVGEEAGDERALQGGGVGVGREVGEMEVV